MTAASPTAEQIDFLLTFLEKYTPLARGYLRSAQNRIRGKKLWEELTRKLNALGGAHKSTKQWQKVWADKKYLVKKAVSASKESETDGGPSSASALTETELRIVKLIGQSSWETDNASSVLALPTLPIVTDQHGVKIEEDCIKIEDDIKIEEDCIKTEEDSLETDADSLETDEASVAVSPAPGPQRRQQVRQRQASHERGFRNRLFRMEKARLAAQELQAQEMSAIRRSLDTLVNLLQTYMHKK